jgi:hypothetical protein
MYPHPGFKKSKLKKKEIYRLHQESKLFLKYSCSLNTVRQWFSNCGTRPPRGAQHTFLQIKIKTALNKLEK